MTPMRARQVLPHALRSTQSAALLGSSLMCALVGVMACGPDPEGKYKDYVEAIGATEGSTGAPLTSTDPGTSTGPGSTSEPTTSDTEAEAPPDISGDFLLAVSTVVDKSKPLQFVATNTVTVDGDKRLLSSCLQPLTLMQGKVTTPRQPIGEPLCFMDLPIVDGTFTIDAGTVMVTGMANPITGADIVASLLMAATVQDADFYCGTVTGEVMEPPIGSIAGSTFAAVRLADKTVLPTDVTINCAKMPTVTDPP